MMDKFRAELHGILKEEGFPLGVFMYQWPDSEEAELFADTPVFWGLRVSRKVKEWAKTQPKAI
jgi:hypothetical protein